MATILAAQKGNKFHLETVGCWFLFANFTAENIVPNVV